MPSDFDRQHAPAIKAALQKKLDEQKKQAAKKMTKSPGGDKKGHRDYRIQDYGK